VPADGHGSPWSGADAQGSFSGSFILVCLGLLDLVYSAVLGGSIECLLIGFTGEF
jgi:hypothetical protein